MPSYEFEGLKPVVHPSAFIHPEAVLIGDVHVGAGCYVGPGASLRADFGRIVLEAGSNVQDNCTMHSFPGCDAVVEADGHVGHGAILHGCRVGRNALVGMNAVIMDRAAVGEGCIVGAMSFVKAGTLLADRTLWAGSPARKIRDVSDEELAWKTEGTKEYHQLAARSRATLRPCEPLAEAEPGRARLNGTYQTLQEYRSKQHGE